MFVISVMYLRMLSVMPVYALPLTLNLQLCPSCGNLIFILLIEHSITFSNLIFILLTILFLLCGNHLNALYVDIIIAIRHWSWLGFGLSAALVRGFGFGSRRVGLAAIWLSGCLADAWLSGYLA